MSTWLFFALQLAGLLILILLLWGLGGSQYR